MKPEEPLRAADLRKNKTYPDPADLAMLTTMRRSKFVAMTPEEFSNWVVKNYWSDAHAFFLAIKWPEAHTYARDRGWTAATCYPGLMIHIKNWPTALLDVIEPEAFSRLDVLLPEMGLETPEEAERRREDFSRTSGACECHVCGKEYRDHPLDGGDETYDGNPVLRVLCDFSRVKL